MDRSAALSGECALPDYDALEHLPDAILRRLRVVIERREPFFILTGSDPGQLGGCCPSDEVGAANGLVKAGILESWNQPAGENTCPTAFYAFRGELDASGDEPKFSTNQEFREEVARILNELAAGDSTVVRLLRWALLGFVAVSLVYFIYGEIAGRRRAGPGEIETIPLLAQSLLGNRGVLVCFFEADEKCDACVNMKLYTRKALDTHFPSEMNDGRIAFHVIKYDTKSGRRIRKRLGIFTSAVVIIEIRDGTEHQRKVLSEAWPLLGSQDRFVNMIRTEIAAMLRDDE